MGSVVLGVLPQALALVGIFDAAVCKAAQRFYKYRKVFLVGSVVLGVLPQALALEGIFDAAVCKTV